MEINDVGESTSARVKRGDTQEIVYRHVSSLILLIPHDKLPVPEKIAPERKESEVVARNERPKRKAAQVCKEKLAATSHLV